MEFLGLPPEILKKIFDQLDPSFFQEDLSRLTVCKKWLEFALPACLKRVTLSHEALRILAASSVAKGSLPVKGHLETVNIDIKGFQHGISTHSPQKYEQGLTSQPTAPYICPWDNQVRDWRVTLDNGLAQLAIVAQQSPRLRTLRVRASSSSLEFPLFPPGGQQVDEYHICPFIGALLPTLQTLHLRMWRICPDVLKTQDPDKKLRLSTVAINLTLDSDEPSLLPAAYSEPCAPHAGGLIQLKADIQEQAEVLVARMESPKTIRILDQNFPQLETRSLDVLTGKIMKLEDDVAWDEDGQTVQEDWEDWEDSETELETPIFQIPDDEFDDFLYD
ncbi:hypothetical protein FDENT_4544 [Fusarium denticulatum]|uniref:F-box domain-containing protein n=1 Tax=Fusarium denticulatum TaxID=48507 RepID=A0A8H5X6D7_9HYPO|nr:hypothetical protein FDENT_4544 [Fusarium denticulatum]